MALFAFSASPFAQRAEPSQNGAEAGGIRVHETYNKIVTAPWYTATSVGYIWSWQQTGYSSAC